MQTREEQLAKIIEYIEQAGLTFTEPFSLISATVVEASYWTGISKNIILVHINKTFKEKYGEKYIKAQKVAHYIAYGKNPDEGKIMSKDVSNELQVKTPKEPKERKKYEFHKDKSEYKSHQASTILGKAYKEYTGMNTKENVKLYNYCQYWYRQHKEFPWDNKVKWQEICKRYGFEDKKLIDK